ncbi:KdsC family phosphatase, partial [bacterium]
MADKINNYKELSNLKLIFFDFDGVFTDNSVYVDQDGIEFVRCNRSDGIGISKLKSIGIESIVLSSEVNPIVKVRCKKLGLECLNALEDKLSELQRIMKEKNLSKHEICYVGNDVNDLECIQFAEHSFAVKDAYNEVIEYAKWITNNNGGYGAVR